MRSLIVYATKHGFTGEIARKLGALVPDSETADISSGDLIDLGPFERIVAGGPVYHGILLRSVRRFCRSNLSELLRKETALFVVGISGRDTLGEYLEAAFPAELRKRSTALGLFRGGIDAEQLNGLESLVVRSVKKIRGSITFYDEADLHAFAEKLEAGHA
jgi:menaquinone-dependent protoporphyrinogen IX oxidase